MKNMKSINDRNSAKEYYLQKKILGRVQFDKNDYLYVFDCAGMDSVTDDDIQYIIFFPEIKAIHLSGKKITDKSIFYFKNLKKLRSIYLYDTNITGKGFIYLKEIKRLGGFVFDGSTISDIGLMYLSEIQYEEEVENLNLRNTKITDEGMKYIAKMKIGKAYISLFNTKVTDEGIKYLAGFKELKEIDLRETKVTDKGGKRLQEQLPNTEIYWGKYIPDTPTGMDEEE